MKKENYIITGMSCSACSARIEKNVSGMTGMKKASVNLLTNTMQVEYDENITNTQAVIKEVTDTGYGASVMGGEKETKAANAADTMRSAQAEEIAGMRHRMVWSFIFLVPLLFVSMHQMFHHLFGVPIPAFAVNYLDGDKNALAFAFTQFIFALPVIYLNRKYFQNGFKTLFQGAPNMDTLIAVGSGASALYGIFAIYRIGYGLGYGDMALVTQYRTNLYFESSAMILTLITFGKYMETKSKGRTSDAIVKLMKLAPKTARVERNGQEETIPVEDLVKGDIIVTRPGERLAADGVIVEGTTSIDEAAITGESIPVEKQKGDKVIAATINKTGFIKFRAEKVGQDTTISQIIKLVEEASSSKAPIAKMADKIAGIFVPVVLVIALIATIVWLVSGATFEFALSIGISVLVVSCPCALGLATPVAIMVGTGKGAENGILIKSGDALEMAHSIDTVVMDKTGTLTVGKPKVTDTKAFGRTNRELLTIAAGLEKGSEHPLAEAVMEAAAQEKIEPAEATDFQATFGKGISATIKDKKYYAGNSTYLKELNIDLHGVDEQINALADEGKTPLLFADEEKIIGIIAVADVEKPTSKETIHLFKEMGVQVVMLTGDNKRTAEAIRRRLDIPKVQAEVLPQDKSNIIMELQKAGHKVAMIGDGVNDAPALAQADLGIAIGAGTDVAIESADAVLVRNDLLDAVSTIKLSKAVIKNIKENLFWAFFYNSVGIPLAAGVLYPVFGLKLTPMFGAAAMSLSSVCVVTNALRLRFFSPAGKNKETKNQQVEMSQNKKEKTTMKKELEIKGMMCQHCQKHVTEALQAMPGVSSVNVDLVAGKATVEMDKEITLAEFAKVIEKAGYELIG